MKIIDEKKINKYIVIVVLFLSFGYAQWQSARGTLAYMSYSYPELAQATWMFNDVVAILTAGLVPLLFFELITSFASRFVAVRGGAQAEELKYSLRFFYIGANIVIGSLKFLYYISPIISVFGNILIDFVITTVFFCLYLFYCAKHYADKTRWGALIISAGGTYLIVEAFVTVFGLITGVLVA